jgi:polyphosphate kinase
MNDTDRFINRELSWLEFNARVLEEARDPRKRPLDRLKFLAIFSSNLDEFFMIRVGGLRHRELDEISSSEAGDGLSTEEVLDRISEKAHELVAEQYRILGEEVFPVLAEKGLRLLTPSEVRGDEAAAMHARFKSDYQAVLTPMVVDPAHPFPHIQNRQLYLAARLRARGRGRLRTPKSCLALVPLPGILPRFIPVPLAGGGSGFVTLEDLIGEHLSDLFSGFEVLEHTVFRLTRDQDFELADQDSEDLVRQIQSELSKRRRGVEVRLEIRAGVSETLQAEIVRWFELGPSDLYRMDGPLNLSAFWSWINLPGHGDLSEAPAYPQVQARIRQHKGDLFSLIRTGDLLLHHPYESFDTVVEFIEQAAKDPDVLAIKQTLYRAGRNSPIVAALARAAEKDKQVTALIELKARFDEEANIEWARTLERAGAHVVYGVPGLKTHCKVSLVVRRDPDRIRRYVHLSTGNYNVFTSLIYTDIGLMTCDDRLGEDASALFNLLTGYTQPERWHRLRVAPYDLREWTIQRIEREAAHARARRPARLVAKLNGLVDREVIGALYRASSDGVPIDLVVRGICCLRPGLPGVSPTIRVRSIVGRYLEHSRILYFANGGTPELWLTSADWMPRNFDRRVEIAFPVEDPGLRARLADEILAAALLDEANARVLDSDGSYRRVQGSFDSHRLLEELASGRVHPLSLPPPPGTKEKPSTARALQDSPP